MYRHPTSSNLEDSLISLASADSLSFDSADGIAQEDITLTSHGEDSNDIALLGASSLSDLVSVNQQDESCVSLSDADASSVTLTDWEDDQCDPDQNLSLPVSLECPKYQVNMSKPLQQSTPHKVRRDDATNAVDLEQSFDRPEARQSTDHDDTLNNSDLSLTWNLCVIMNMKGCAEQCLKKVHQLNEYSLLQAHSQFQSKTILEQNAWVTQYLECHCPLKGINCEKDIKGISYVIQGKSLCLPTWLQVLGISRTRFYRIRDEFKLNGGIKYLHKSQHHSHRPKTLRAISWMDQYFKKIGDKRPDHDGIYLPTCLTELKIYEIMLEELYNGKDGQGISYSKFCTIFKEDFKSVTIPKHCRFTKCDYCTLLKSEMFKPGVTKEEKKSLQELKDEHLALQEQERARYYTNRQLAIDNPEEYVSLILDGMDQNKTNLPSLVRVTKSCQNLWTLRTHLTGVIAHGSGSHYYFDFLQFPHDSNLTLFALLKTLEELNRYKKLPAKLMIQMDNCSRENKNKYVFGFLAILVELNIFTEIELGFLMVGHTHEDIDQHFSCLSRYLKKNSALTLEDMMQAAKSSNHMVTNVSCVKYIFDIREWILPHLEPIRYHTEPHIFLFKKNSANKAALFYKAWSHCDWEPSNEGHILLKSLPTGKPSLVQPNLSKQDIKQMKKDMPKYEATGLFPEGTKQKWEEFLENFNTVYGQTPSDPVWQLDEFEEVKERCPRAGEPTTAISDKVHKHSRAAKEIRKIEVGKKSTCKRPAIPATATSSKKTCTAVTTPIPAVGSFVAVCCKKYEEFNPQIGRIKSFDETSVTLEWLEGTYSSTWVFWKHKNKIVTETIPLRSILHSPIIFTNSMRLKTADKTILKNKYDTAEYV